ncbi:MAG: hypothetical protein KIT20_10920 [Alphaproteobacteria bacterium]|nr:hypothetical protein [Alphaproteobacteria bacterium]
MSRFSILAFCLAMSAIVPIEARAQAPDSASEQAYCAALVRQFDRYYVRGEGGTGSVGSLDRALGDKLCRDGRYAEGQERLRRAIRAIGFVPVERP